ncbi:MAG: carbohydrate ABC transporter permease, partial [Clostridia bacterium]
MDIDKMTLSAGISSLLGQHSTKYPILMAGSALAMIPMLVLYLVFQRQFIEGIALTGTKA